MDYAVDGGKILVKFGLNMICPGSGIAVDLIETGYHVYNGNYTEAAFIASTSLMTIGLGAAKEAAQKCAKDASINMARQACKASVDRKAKQEIGARLAKELASGLTNDATKEAFKQSSKTVALKAATLSLVENGGNIPIALLEGATEGILNKCTADAASPKLLTYSFGSAATSAAKKVADSHYDAEFVLRAGKAIVKCCESLSES